MSDMDVAANKKRSFVSRVAFADTAFSDTAYIPVSAAFYFVGFGLSDEKEIVQKENQVPTSKNTRQTNR